MICITVKVVTPNTALLHKDSSVVSRTFENSIVMIVEISIAF